MTLLDLIATAERLSARFAAKGLVYAAEAWADLAEDWRRGMP